jgi:hypothetical protein
VPNILIQVNWNFWFHYTVLADSTPEILSSQDVSLAIPAEDENIPEIPTHVPYLLIGAGTASFAAYRLS